MTNQTWNLARTLHRQKFLIHILPFLTPFLFVYKHLVQERKKVLFLSYPNFFLYIELQRTTLNFYPTNLGSVYLLFLRVAPTQPLPKNLKNISQLKSHVIYGLMTRTYELGWYKQAARNNHLTKSFH